MNLDTPREAFLQQLQLAASFCPTRSPRPILQDVVVDASDGEVTLLATDGEISLRTTYRDEAIRGDGRAALPAQTLLSAVRALPNESLSIEESGPLHQIAGDSAQFKLHGDDPDLFPSIPTGTGGTGAVTVPLKAFLDLCNRTTFAAAKDMGRYAFNGVLLELDKQEITLVATDGRRLSMAKMECDTGLDERRSAIVPVRGLAQLQRAAGEAEGDLRIDARENQVSFVLKDTEIVVQLVEGEFPDFRAVLPKSQDTPRTVELDREELASAIRRAAVTAGEQGRAVELVFEKGLLKVTSRQEGVGEARSEMNVDYEGEAVGIRFNPEFLGDYLKTLAEPAVTFRFKDRSSAGLFTASQASMYVVMPITS
ncbi:MAG: DNA polymerase III subunit beta [Planctomycetota bacterium]|jgi:DNA polymerase-3 subunit beta